MIITKFDNQSKPALLINNSNIYQGLEDEPRVGIGRAW